MISFILLSKMISFGALMSRSFNEIRKQTTTAQLFLNWQLLIIFNWIENFIYYFMSQPWYTTIFFLILKLFIVYLPVAIHHAISVKLKNLHFEVVYDIIRCGILNAVFRIFLAETRYLMGFLDDQERKALRDAVVAQMQGESRSVVLSSTPKPLQSQYIQRGISSPTALTPAYIPPAPVPVQPVYRDDRFQMKNSSQDRTQMTQSSRNPIAESGFKKVQRTPEYIIEREKYTQPQQQTYQYQERPMVKTSSPTTLQKYTETQQYKQMANRRSANQAAMRSLNQRSERLIDEIGMSVSQYSGMDEYQEEQFSSRQGSEVRSSGPMRMERDVRYVQRNNQPMRVEKDIRYVMKQVEPKRGDSPLGRMITKAQTYVQMGTKAYPRLEKYVVELYAGDKMQIVSLYGRVFERHTLLYMKPMENDYFEMHFSEDSTPNTRLIKFKTNMGEFAKYIQP